MAYDEGLAERVRAALDDLIVRVPAERTDEFLTKPAAKPFPMMKGQAPRGFVLIGPPGTKDGRSLSQWVRRGFDFAESLPPKKAKPRGKTSAKRR